MFSAPLGLPGFEDPGRAYSDPCLKGKGADLGRCLQQRDVDSGKCEMEKATPGWALPRPEGLKFETVRLLHFCSVSDLLPAGRCAPPGASKKRAPPRAQRPIGPTTGRHLFSSVSRSLCVGTVAAAAIREFSHMLPRGAWVRLEHDPLPRRAKSVPTVSWWR